MADKYEVVQDGEWRYRIIDTSQNIPVGYGDLGHPVVVITYSKAIAELCLSALNNTKVENSDSPASPVQQRYAEIAAQMGNVAEDNDSGLPEWIRDALSSWAHQLQQ